MMQSIHKKFRLVDMTWMGMVDIEANLTLLCNHQRFSVLNIKRVGPPQSHPKT